MKTHEIKNWTSQAGWNRTWCGISVRPSASDPGQFVGAAWRPVPITEQPTCVKCLSNHQQRPTNEQA